MAYQLTDEDRKYAQSMALQQMGGYSLPTNRPSVASTKKKKGFLLDNVSTGGSLAGALAGGAAGTAVLPGIGTIIGAVLGGSAGGGLGQVAENSYAGDDLGKDVGSEALWGGLTALPFGSVGKLAKAGGTLAKGLGSDAAKLAAKDLVNEAGVKAMSQKAVQQLSLSDALKAAPAKAAAERLGMAPSLGQKVAGKLTGAADDLAVKQFRLAPGQISSFKKLHGEDPGALIRRMGITNTEDVATKGIEPLQNAFDSVVKNIPAISSKELDGGLKSVYEPLLKSPALFQQQLGNQLKTQAEALVKHSNSGSISAEAVNELRRTFDSAVKYTQKGAPDANVAKETADALRGILQKTADNAGVKSVDGKTFKEIGLDLSKMYGLDDIVSKQSELGRGSLPLSLPNMLGAVVGGGAGGIPGITAGIAATSLANSSLGRKVVSGTLDKAASKLASTAPANISQSLKQAAIRMGGAGAARTALNGNQSLSDLSNMDMTAPMSNATNTPMAVNMPESYSQDAQMSNPLGYSSTEIGQALMSAYADGNDKAAKQLEGMYQLASEWEKSQTTQPKALTQGQQERADLLTALDNTEGVMAGGSIDYGQIGSRLNDIKSTFNAADPETLSFKNTVSGLRAAITKARAGASLTAGELKMLDQYTPSSTDSEQVVRSKLQALRQLYGNTMPQGGGVDQGTLQSALGY